MELLVQKCTTISGQKVVGIIIPDKDGGYRVLNEEDHYTSCKVDENQPIRKLVGTFNKKEIFEGELVEFLYDVSNSDVFIEAGAVQYKGMFFYDDRNLKWKLQTTERFCFDFKRNKFRLIEIIKY